MQDAAFRVDSETPEKSLDAPKGRGSNPRSLANLKRVPKGGASPNPRGRGKKDFEAAAAAEELAPDAIKALGEIINDPQAPASSRVSAASEILDRAYGRAPQSIKVNAELSFSEQFEQFIRELNAARTIDHDRLASQDRRVDAIELEVCDGVPEGDAGTVAG